MEKLPEKPMVAVAPAVLRRARTASCAFTRCMTS